MTTESIDILRMTFEELCEFVAAMGCKPFRAKQIFQALHEQFLTDFDDMTVLSKALRAELKEKAYIPTVLISKMKQSSDGTRKYQLKTHDGHLIESVFIPDAATEGRNTICISSQVGCAMGCTWGWVNHFIIMTMCCVPLFC